MKCEVCMKQSNDVAQKLKPESRAVLDKLNDIFETGSYMDLLIFLKGEESAYAECSLGGGQQTNDFFMGVV